MYKTPGGTKITVRHMLFTCLYHTVSAVFCDLLHGADACVILLHILNGDGYGGRKLCLCAAVEVEGVANAR